MAKHVTVAVGEMVSIGFTKDRICYAGMPNPGTFSIGVRRWEYPHLVYSWNLYFPRRKQDITIDGVNLYVENVTPEEIRFRVQ